MRLDIFSPNLCSFSKVNPRETSGHDSAYDKSRTGQQNSELELMNRMGFLSRMFTLGVQHPVDRYHVLGELYGCDLWLGNPRLPDCTLWRSEKNAGKKSTKIFRCGG